MLPWSPSSEPDPEYLSSRDVADVATQTYELPCALPSDISLVLTGCRIYSLWHLEGACLQLPGLHIGRGATAWGAILHLAPSHSYIPGLVRVQRVHRVSSESDSAWLDRARDIFLQECRRSATPSMTSLLRPPSLEKGVEQKKAWVHAFGAGQEKLIAAERLLPLVHLLPLSVLDGDPQHSAILVETFVVCLVWSEGALPHEELEQVVFCVPLGVAGEGAGVEAVGLALYGNGREMMGDCNVTYVCGPPETLSQLLDAVPAQAPVELLTFAEHQEGGCPRAAEAFSHWSAELGDKCYVYLDLDSDALRAVIAGQLLEDDVFLSASEEDIFEGDPQRALLVLSKEQAASAAAAAPAPGAQSKQPTVRPGAPKRGTPSVAGSQNLGGLGHAAAGRGSLLVEQQAQSLVQRMKEAKAKATAKSQEVGEVASILLSGLQQLGERMNQLEQRAQSPAPLRSPPPASRGSATLTGVGQRGHVSARPIAPPVLGAGPQFGGVIGSQMLKKGLLAPKETAGMRSYQSALQQAQAQLLDTHADGATGAGSLGNADVPGTRGRERGTGRALRELLQQQQGAVDGSTQLLMQVTMLEALESLAGRAATKEPETLEDLLLGSSKDEEDASKLGASSRGSTNLTRWHMQVERNPELFIEMFNSQVVKALGADITGAPWSVQQYASTRVQFKRLDTHEKAFYMLAALHSHGMRGEHTLALAKTCQFMKALEQSTQQNGSWKSAWLLTGLPDPRPPPGGYQQGLSHSAELGLTAAYLKELKLLEEAAKKESDGSATGAPGGDRPRKGGGGKGDHTKGTPGTDGK
eukprot:6463869-Amphidinium_carterae.1